MADLQKIMIEKEQTKRQEQRYEYELEIKKIEAENEKAFWRKAILIMVIFFAVFIFMVLYGTLT